MKSIIAQGATISKAIDDALQRAGQPQEFFVKVLEEAQAGFLGFGSKKAKIALFFRKEDYSRKDSEILPQNAYRDLFNNDTLEKQIKSQQGDEQIVSKPKFQQDRKFQPRKIGAEVKKDKPNGESRIQQNKQPSRHVESRPNVKSVNVKHQPNAKNADSVVKKQQESNKQRLHDGQPKSEDQLLQRRRLGAGRSRSSQYSRWRTKQNRLQKADESKDPKESK